eukprot:726334_1
MSHYIASFEDQNDDSNDDDLEEPQLSGFHTELNLTCVTSEYICCCGCENIAFNDHEDYKLPRGWSVVYTHDGQPYFWDELTNTSTWKRPLHTSKHCETTPSSFYPKSDDCAFVHAMMQKMNFKRLMNAMKAPHRKTTSNNNKYNHMRDVSRNPLFTTERRAEDEMFALEYLKETIKLKELCKEEGYEMDDGGEKRDEEIGVHDIENDKHKNAIHAYTPTNDTPLVSVKCTEKHDSRTIDRGAKRCSGGLNPNAGAFIPHQEETQRYAYLQTDLQGIPEEETLSLSCQSTTQEVIKHTGGSIISKNSKTNMTNMYSNPSDAADPNSKATATDNFNFNHNPFTMTPSGIKTVFDKTSTKTNIHKQRANGEELHKGEMDPKQAVVSDHKQTPSDYPISTRGTAYIRRKKKKKVKKRYNGYYGFNLHPSIPKELLSCVMRMMHPPIEDEEVKMDPLSISTAKHDAINNQRWNDYIRGHVIMQCNLDDETPQAINLAIGRDTRYCIYEHNRLKDQLYTASQAHDAFLIELPPFPMNVDLLQQMSEERATILRMLRNETTRHKIITNYRQKHISVFKRDKKNNTQFMLKMEITRFRRTVIDSIRACGVRLKLIPYVHEVLNQKPSIHNMCIVRIWDEPTVNIGVSFKLIKRNNRSAVHVTGIHLDRDSMMKQHQLIDPYHDCHCFDGFTSCIHDFQIISNGDHDKDNARLKHDKQQLVTFLRESVVDIEQHNFDVESWRPKAQALVRVVL